MVLAILAVAAAYLLYKSGTLQSLGQSLGVTDQSAAVTPQWPPQPGQPGYVTLGGSPAGADWSPQPGTAQKAISLTGTASGLAGTVGSSSFAATGTALGTAIPIIGIGVAVVGTVLGIIAKHHQQALANEGKVLNDALPRALNAMILVAQAAVRGEVKSTSQARQLLDQIVSDYYGEVRPIQSGTWHYTGEDLSADYQKVWIQRFQPKAGAPGYSDYHAPDPCNAACVIGHFFAERNTFLVMNAVSDILNGVHGTLTLPQVPKYMTQAGFPEIRMVY